MDQALIPYGGLVLEYAAGQCGSGCYIEAVHNLCVTCLA